MRRFIYILTVLSLCSCSSHMLQVQKYDIKGRVEKVKETVYDAIEKFGDVSLGEIHEVYVYELDQNGYLSKKTTYDKNGKKIGETELILDKNRLVKYSNWNLYSIGKYSFEQKYEGKSGSYLLETTNVKGEKTYLTQKKQHRIVTTYSSSRVKSEEKLNWRGNTVSETTYNEDGTTTKVFYKYGRKGEVISMKIIEQNNTTVVFKHNRKGDYIINQMDNTKRFVKYTEFDKKGNWIKSITYEDDEPIIVTKRDIMYR